MSADLAARLPYTPVDPLTSYEPTKPTYHRSYSLNYKLQVVEWIEQEGCSLRAASKQFGLDRKVIRSWLKNRDHLKSALALHGPDKKKLHQGRPPKSEELDKQVLEYLLSLRSEGVSVSDQALQRKARECAGSLGLKDFKAAATWLKRWKQRCGVYSRDGTNDVMATGSTHFQGESERNDAQEVCHLSHVTSCEQVKLIANWSSLDTNRSCDSIDGPVHFDLTTNEHNYCKPSTLLLHEHSLASTPLDLNSADVAYRMLQCSTVQDDQPFPITSSDHPAVLAVFGTVPTTNDDVVMIFDPGDPQCIMGSLELPLSHEEIVQDDDDNSDDVITVNQTTVGEIPPDTSFPSEFTPLPSSAPDTHTDHQDQALLLPSPTQSQSKPRRTKTTKRRRGSRRSSNNRPVTLRNEKPPEVSLSQVPLPNLMLDDPRGPSGLLASRMLQPVFPDEPEIVYMDMQLGTLNMTH